MILEVEQRLSFQYDAYISESFLELRLQPETSPHQTLAAFLLAVGPPTQVYRYRDWNGNTAHHFTITKFHDRIEITSRSLVETHPKHPPLAQVTDRLPLGDLSYELRDLLDLGGPIRATPRLRRFRRALGVPAGLPLGQRVQLLTEGMRARLAYRKHVTRYDSTTEDFLRAGGGVCQDFTHLMLALLRLDGVPCRYVSGYLHVPPRRGEPAQSHAWIEFHSPQKGWVAYDPTHGREVDEPYVVVARGRHYDDVPPNKGIYRGNAREVLRTEVHTRPSTRKGISTLHEEIQHIDVPVFQEIPDRRRVDRWFPAAEEAASQQQQQQARRGGARPADGP